MHVQAFLGAGLETENVLEGGPGTLGVSRSLSCECSVFRWGNEIVRCER